MKRWLTEWKRDQRKSLVVSMFSLIIVVLTILIVCGLWFNKKQGQPAYATDIQTQKSTEGITETAKLPTEEMTTTEEATSEEETTQPESETEAQPQTAPLDGSYIPPSLEDFIINENVDEFFADSVFVGDSVMVGFRNYVMNQAEGFLNSPEFLVSGSFSVRMALKKVDDKTIHPIYQGKQRQIQESLSMIGAKKVFLFFGLNDIGMEGVDGTFTAYQTLIDRIRESIPEIEIYVISTTYMRAGSEKEILNNTNIRLLNTQMKEYCDNNQIGYINIADYLKDEKGALRKDYCSDEYVHQTPAAYDVWVHVLRCYASGGQILVKPEEEATSEEATDIEESGGLEETTAGEVDTTAA